MPFLGSKELHIEDKQSISIKKKKILKSVFMYDLISHHHTNVDQSKFIVHIISEVQFPSQKMRCANPGLNPNIPGSIRGTIQGEHIILKMLPWLWSCLAFQNKFAMCLCLETAVLKPHCSMPFYTIHSFPLIGCKVRKGPLRSGSVTICCCSRSSCEASNIYIPITTRSRPEPCNVNM